ncbi:hypothetical protein Gotri_016937 [Gossypium trilobum]|uniref:Cytochrome b561 domain-containing protein n=1 Tax=Gossypium trilobum TaxID=34281 RepID=A0A7J9E5Q4_9ROSI|nr:hypothetical protein [Gossypium trilobum]
MWLNLCIGVDWLHCLGSHYEPQVIASVEEVKKVVHLVLHVIALILGAAGLRRESLPWHVVVGLFVYILAVANAAIGFLEKLTVLESSGLAKYGAEAYLVNFTAIVTILYGALGLVWMSGVFSSGEIKNSGGGKISYCSGEIGYCSSEIRNSGGVCVWIQTQL